MLPFIREFVKDLSAPHIKRNNGLAIFLMAVVALLFAIIDAKARFLTQTIDPLVVAWSRQSGLLIVLLALYLLSGYSVFKTYYFWLQVLRGCLTAASAVLYIYVLKFVPLVEVIAVTFIAPLFMCLLAVIFLSERMSPFRWAVLTFGFLGAMIIIRPGLGLFHPAIFLVLLEALLFSLRQIITRKISDKDPPTCTIAYTAIVGWLLLCLPLPWVWVTPESSLEIVFLISTSLLAALAEVLTIVALARALVNVVAPVHYSMLIWGTLISWVFFDHFPDSWTILGGSIIVISGLLLMRKETG